MSKARSVKLGGFTYLYTPIISIRSVGKGRVKRERGRGRGVVASDMRARSCWPLSSASSKTQKCPTMKVLVGK